MPQLNSDAAIATALDHLLVAAPDLTAGCTFLYDVLGVRPFYGGVHPGQGTRNAILALADSTYLELIAPDPNQTCSSPILEAIKLFTAPALAWWVVRCTDLEGAARKLASAGVETSPIMAGSRRTSDDKLLRWRLMFIQAPEVGAAAPFLINWQGTAHPAAVEPKSGALVRLAISHPNATRLRQILAAVGLCGSVDVSEAPLPCMDAHIETSQGRRVVLTTPERHAPAISSG